MRSLSRAIFRIILIAIFSALAIGVQAEERVSDGLVGKMSHPVLVGNSGDLRIISPEGEIIWRYSEGVGPVHDCCMLDNGNVMYADGKSVTEVSRDGKIVFRYEPKNQKGGATFACQRLAGGNTMIGVNSDNKIIEVDPSGKIVFSMTCAHLDKIGSHHNMRIARKLDNGNYLVSQQKAATITEYKPSGEIVQEFPGKGIGFFGMRLKNGNTLVSYCDELVEYDKDAKPVWSFKKDAIQGVTLTYMCGLCVLPNGNIAIGCYAPYRGGAQGNSILEITRDKKLVWRLQDFKWPGSSMGIQVLQDGVQK